MTSSPAWRETAEIVATTFRERLSQGGTEWLRAACPMCEEADGKRDKKLSLGLNPQTSGWSCFRCGQTGRLPADLRADLGLEDAGDYVPTTQTGGLAPAAPPIESPDGYVPLYEPPHVSDASLDWGRTYLEGKRRLDPVALRQMGAGAAAYGRLYGRVIFPIVGPAGLGGPWLGWFGRDALGSNPLKHRYPKGMSRADLLWNMAALELETDAPLYVCEGILDAAPLWPDGVACLGKPLDSHVARLERVRRPVVCLLDGDAWEESWMLSLRLRFSGVRAGFIRLPPKTDPNDADPAWLRDEGAKCLQKAP